MERLIIAVLEDQISRVEWLKEEFPMVEIVYASTVVEFFEKQYSAEQTGRLVLNILDHDLGISQYVSGKIPDIIDAIGTSEDINGQTGMAVAETLVTDAPTIIWSANAHVQWPMLNAMRDRTMQAVVIPAHDQGTLKSVIMQLLISRVT